MVIYELDTSDQIDRLKKNLGYVIQIKDSISDETAEYRLFANARGMDYDILRDCCDSYEKTLLIDVYTYSEQLFKNFYYHLVEKDRSENKYINNFINKKLDSQHFSPNVEYATIEKNIRDELIPSFKFIIKNEREEIRKYNDLVSTRHKYAHRGIYSFGLMNYSDVIAVEEYLTAEVSIIIHYGAMFHIELQNELVALWGKGKNLEGKFVNYSKSHNSSLRSVIVDELRIIKKLSRDFLKKYEGTEVKCQLLQPLFESLKNLSDIDLRKISLAEVLIQEFISCYQTMKLIEK